MWNDMHSHFVTQIFKKKKNKERKENSDWLAIIKDREWSTQLICPWFANTGMSQVPVREPEPCGFLDKNAGFFTSGAAVQIQLKVLNEMRPLTYAKTGDPSRSQLRLLAGHCD